MYSGKSQGSLFVLIESDWSCKIGKWRLVTSSTIYNPTWFNLFSFLHFCLFVTAKQSNYYVTLISYFAQENGWHSPSFWHNYWLFTRASCCLLFTKHFRKIQSESQIEAAWPSGQRVGLAIRRSRVRVPLWPLAGFVLGRPEFKFSATLVNSQLVAFCQLGFLILLCCIWIICF